MIQKEYRKYTCTSVEEAAHVPLLTRPTELYVKKYIIQKYFQYLIQKEYRNYTCTSVEEAAHVPLLRDLQSSTLRNT